MKIKVEKNAYRSLTTFSQQNRHKISLNLKICSINTGHFQTQTKKILTRMYLNICNFSVFEISVVSSMSCVFPSQKVKTCCFYHEKTA